MAGLGVTLIRFLRQSACARKRYPPQVSGCRQPAHFIVRHRDSHVDRLPLADTAQGARVDRQGIVRYSKRGQTFGNGLLDVLLRDVPCNSHTTALARGSLEPVECHQQPAEFDAGEKEQKNEWGDECKLNRRRTPPRWLRNCG